MKKIQEDNYPRFTYFTYSNYYIELSEKDKRAMKAFWLQLKRKWIHLIEMRYPNMA